jgi:hypothetical protein
MNLKGRGSCRGVTDDIVLRIYLEVLSEPGKKTLRIVDIMEEDRSGCLPNRSHKHYLLSEPVRPYR